MKTAELAPSARPVLVIEDDTATREALAALLSGAGLRVIASDEGRKALELAGATRPALVLLDLVTGGMSGREFLERRAAVPALAGVPVVIVTGSSEAPPRSADAVFRKPVDPGELLRKVRSLLRRAASPFRP
jgi:two-component system, OmpR family, response regulator ResD